MAAKSGSAETLSGLLDKIERRVDEQGPKSTTGKLTLGEIMDIIGRRAYGPLLLIVGILSVSPLSMIPGSTWMFAALTLLIAMQMAINRKHPWLPSGLLKTSFPQDKVSGALKKVRPWTSAVDKIVRPRFEFLARAPWLILVALLAIAAALVTFPLSFIPLAPFLPGATVILIGLGVTARDGLVLGLAMGILAGGAVWLALRFF